MTNQPTYIQPTLTDDMLMTAQYAALNGFPDDAVRALDAAAALDTRPTTAPETAARDERAFIHTSKA